MAKSTCPKCSNGSFEMVESDNVKDSKFKIMFIQCTSCGAVVGTTDFYNIPNLLEKIAKKLGFNLHG
ncbi:MAG: hypothetical protein EOO68_20595 [Moraxellaceae bacterium]|jgi:hypothetical protein|nr:MAG: hypothetical protein EOO68_20595 [Moraxellaceae bacterium]